MNIFSNSVKLKIGLVLFLTAIASVLTADIPRPEHPRPDMLRTNWMTLNGEWQFEIDETGNGEQRGLMSGKDLKANFPGWALETVGILNIVGIVAVLSCHHQWRENE